MPDLSELEVVVSNAPVLVSLAVRPEEIEFALATHGESLRQRLLLALVAELTVAEAA